MIRATSIALAGAMALSACQIDIVEPGPSPGASIGDRPSRAVMRDACTQAAQDQGVAVLSVGQFDTVTGSGGMRIGTTTMMRVSRGNETFDVRCSYSFGDEIARITLA